MRRIAVFERITLEGFFTDGDGNEQTLFVNDDELNNDLMSGAGVGTYLFGRRTYEHMAAFWPQAINVPDLPPAVRKMAELLNGGEKIVFSKTLKNPTWANTRVLSDVVRSEIDAMKQLDGPDMLILGSGSIVSQLTQHGLIDDYMFVVGPLFAGRGRPLFRDVDLKTSLILSQCKSYKSGNVLLRYVRA